MIPQNWKFPFSQYKCLMFICCGGLMSHGFPILPIALSILIIRSVYYRLPAHKTTCREARPNFVEGFVPEYDPAYNLALTFGMNPKRSVLLKGLPRGGSLMSLPNRLRFCSWKVGASIHPSINQGGVSKFRRCWWQIRTISFSISQLFYLFPTGDGSQGLESVPSECQPLK